MFNHTLSLSLDNDRHLVIGDIHGKYEELQRLLDQCNYDPAKDVLYTVGDMIDRGPNSIDVVNFFMNEERRYVTIGNHELMSISSEWRETWLANGGLAFYHESLLKDIDIRVFTSQFWDLPTIIEVGEPDEEHAFRIVHAEIPPSWSDDELRTRLGEALGLHDPLVSPLIWARTIAEAAKKNLKNMQLPHAGIAFNPNRTRMNFTGHTPVHNPIKCGDHWLLDTFNSRTLTMIDAITFEKFRVPIHQ